jgi:adenylate cyclase
MTGERVERRLAAILAADVAGYGRLMGQDDAGTLARFRAHRRELIDPNLARAVPFRGAADIATPRRCVE